MVLQQLEPVLLLILSVDLLNQLVDFVHVTAFIQYLLDLDRQLRAILRRRRIELAPVPSARLAAVLLRRAVQME